MIKIKDTRILIALAIPLIASALVEASLGFTSTIFLSHLGISFLEAGALVAWFFATLMVVVWGLFSAVSVSIANRKGAKDNEAIAHIVRDGLWLAVALTIPTTLLVWNMAPILYKLGQSKALILVATPYLHALAWSVFPDLIGIVLLQLVVGLGHGRTNLVFTISWVILNVSANYVFIFGCFGSPALGIVGLGWATAFSFWLSTIAWLIYLLCRKQYRGYFKKVLSFSVPFYYRELTQVGLPVGLMLCIEVAFFFALLLLVGNLNVMFIAAAQITMQYLGLFVSVLFAIAQAVSVRVSNRLGAGEISSIKNIVHSGLLFALFLMGMLVIFAWVFPEQLIDLDFSSHISDNLKLIDYSKVFLRIGVSFLLLEAIRITLFGALRGLKDTTFTLIGSFISFWVIAIPLGYCLTYYFHFGVIGFWLGLLASGFFGAGFLKWRYVHIITETPDQ